MSICCADLDGTITADPAFYRGELRGLMDAGHDVHILTGNPDAEKVLAALDFKKGRHFTHVAVVPHPHIAATKVAYMRHVGATHLIDDRRKNCRAARKAGFTAHHHMNPRQED